MQKRSKPAVYKREFKGCAGPSLELAGEFQVMFGYWPSFENLDAHGWKRVTADRNSSVFHKWNTALTFKRGVLETIGFVRL